MRKIAVVGLMMAMGGRLVAEPELRGTASDLSQYLAGVPRTVVVIGEAEVKVPADYATVSLKVSTDSKSLQEALRANHEVRNRLINYLKKQEIPADRVAASKFSSTPKFGLFGEKAKSYRVDNVVKVKVLDEKELQATSSAVDSWPEVQFVGVDFEHTDKEAQKRKAIELACENATERKKVYEEKLGLKLTPKSFSGGMVSQNEPVMINGGSYRGDAYSSSKGIAPSGPAHMAELAQVEEGISSFGELVYAVTINVEYEVAGKETGAK